MPFVSKGKTLPSLLCPLTHSPFTLRSEEYTFTINQSAIEQIFQGVPHLQAAHMQSPYLLHNLVERMKIERMRRKDALAVMMKLNKIPNDKVAAKLAREGGLDTASVESILSGTPQISGLGGNSSSSGNRILSEEEDRVRVITLRSMTTNGTPHNDTPPHYPSSSGDVLHCQGSQQSLGATFESCSEDRTQVSFCGRVSFQTSPQKGRWTAFCLLSK